jgi:ribosomal biogenesis protein LAS1
VDPLQLGAYARPIASIAAQLGLPGWLVELRHAATHEDLPSLELLREAARQSMSWLLRNYFLPTLNPSSAVHSHLAPLRPLLPILKQYKSIFKITIRDVSLRTQYNTATNYILREIERWVTEAKVAANIAVGGFGWDVDISAENGDQDVKERWALDRLCEALLEKGALIPTSKKKRIFPVDTFLPPRFSVLLWTPLLSHLQSHHPDLPSVLADHIINLLLSNGGPQAELKRDDFSFDMCLARWVFWIIDEWSDGFDLKKDVMTTFVTALGPGMKQLVGDRKVYVF